MGSQTSSLVFLHYLTTVFDTISDAVLLIGIEPNNHFRLLTANATFHRTTGLGRETIGRLVHEIIEPETYKKLTKHYKNVIATKKPIEYTEWSTLPVGHQAYHVQLIPILNSVGECAQLAVIAQNVTELETLRKQLKAQSGQKKDGPDA